jgi:ABC-type branched-subunit amino acid transport system ATPase component
MDIVFSFAQKISVIFNGEAMVEDLPDDVTRNPRVKAVYLGEETDA